MKKSFGKMPEKTSMDNFKGSCSCASHLAEKGVVNPEYSYASTGTFLGLWMNFVFSRQTNMKITTMMIRNEIFQYQSHDYSYLYGKHRRISNG